MRTRIDENAHASKLHQCRGGMMIFSCTRKLLLDRAITLPAVARKCRHAVRMKLKNQRRANDLPSPATVKIGPYSKPAKRPCVWRGTVIQMRFWKVRSSPLRSRAIFNPAEPPLRIDTVQRAPNCRSLRCTWPEHDRRKARFCLSDNVPTRSMCLLSSPNAEMCA